MWLEDFGRGKIGLLDCGERNVHAVLKMQSTRMELTERDKDSGKWLTMRGLRKRKGGK